MTDISKLSKNEMEAVLARRAYFKAYREKNKDKLKAYQKSYWERKAQELVEPSKK